MERRNATGKKNEITNRNQWNQDRNQERNQDRNQGRSRKAVCSRKTAVYFACYTAGFAVFACIAFLTFLRFDRTLIWAQDGISQYYPRTVYFSNYIRELISGVLHGNFELPMYDFSIGMGSEIIYSFEPLQFLFVLFPEDKIEFAYNMITILRFYAAGITCSVLCFYFKKEYFPTFIASILYIFGGFALYGGARHTMFMVPMILLPLLIVAMEELLFRKRWHLFTVLVAVSLFSNYYFLYMNTIGLGIYFLVRYFCCREEKLFGDFMRKGLRICGSYLLGVAMASIILVCNFGQYVGSGRSGSAIIKTPSLWYYSKEWLLRCFMSFLTTANSPGEWLKLGFLPVAFLTILLLFLRKGRKELKLLSVITLIMMAVPAFGFVFSGFSFVQNRWCYMAALLAAFVTAEMLPEITKMKPLEYAVCGTMVLLYTALAFFGPVLSTRYTKIAAVCLILTFAFGAFCQYAPKVFTDTLKRAAALLLTAALVLVNGHTLFSMSGVVKEYTVPGEAQKEAVRTPLAALSQLEDDTFYRAVSTETEFSALSSSLLLDYNGVSVFYSTINKSIIEYLSQMGCIDFGTTVIYGMDNRAFMNALASVKYCGEFAEAERAIPYGYKEILQTEESGERIRLYQNKYALPLGYTYREAIAQEDLEQYETVQRQEVLMQRVMLNEKDLETVSERADGFGQSEKLSKIQITSEPLEITSVTTKHAELTEQSMTARGDGRHTITLEFEGKPNAETYLVLEKAFLEGDGSENPIYLTIETEGNSFRYRFRSDDDRYKTGQEDFVFHLGYHEEPITSCEIRMSREGTIEFDALKLYSQSMEHTKAYTKALTEDVLEQIEVGTNRVSGSIALDEDKILVLSIPYQKGWTAYVDGEEAELLRANYMYMALPLQAGEHTIELQYEIAGIKATFVIMPLAALVFVLFCIYDLQKNRRKARGK